MGSVPDRIQNGSKDGEALEDDPRLAFIYNYTFRFDPRDLLERYVDKQPRVSMSDVHRALALRIETDRANNWRLIQRLRMALQVASNAWTIPSNRWSSMEQREGLQSREPCGQGHRMTEQIEIPPPHGDRHRFRRIRRAHQPDHGRNEVSEREQPFRQRHACSRKPPPANGTGGSPSGEQVDQR